MSQKHATCYQSGFAEWTARAEASGLGLRLVVFCGLLLFTFWESVLISHGAGSEVVFVSLTLPGMAVLMLALACGVLMGGVLDAMLGKSTPEASIRFRIYPFLPLFFAFGAAVLLLMAAHFYDVEDHTRALAAVFAGAQLPRLLTLLAYCGPLRIQALLFACAHALGEVCALEMSKHETGLLKALFYDNNLLLAMVIAVLGLLHLAAGRLPVVCPVDPASDRPHNSKTEVIATLMGVALLFFLLHAMHDYAFRLYAVLNQGPPVWIKQGLRLVFPALALIVSKWGLMPLAAVSVAMSALAPALELFPANTTSYWGVLVVDIIGLHGGLLFFMLAFSGVAWQQPFGGLLRSLPFLCLYVTFGCMGIFNENAEADPLHMLVACLVILGVQVGVMVCMQSRWSAMLCSPDHASTSIEEPEAGPQADASVEAFALDNGISPRETQVLHLVCEGLSYAQMASRLFISENTIKVHVSTILRKTNSKNKTQLVCKIFDQQRQLTR